MIINFTATDGTTFEFESALGSGTVRFTMKGPQAESPTTYNLDEDDANELALALGSVLTLATGRATD